jgi:hypothetical protein
MYQYSVTLLTRNILIIMIALVLLACGWSRPAYAQSSISLSGPAGNNNGPSISLTEVMSIGNKAGTTTHEIFGPYNTSEGDPGALYIGTGQSPTGGRNDIILYNLGCNLGTCNVPIIQLFADTTIATGELQVGGGVSSTGSGLKHVRAGGCSVTGNNLSCSVIVSWPGAAFADTNYTAVCTPENATGWLSITSKTTSSVTATVQGGWINTQGFTVAGSMTGVECMAMHD